MKPLCPNIVNALSTHEPHSFVACLYLYPVGPGGDRQSTRPSGWAAAKKRGRPICIDGQFIRLGELPTMSPPILADRVRRANEEALATCLADSSLRTYKSAMESWCRCATFYSFDVWCRNPDGTPMDVPGCIDLLDLYIGFECSLRQIKPDTIRSVYLQGIAKQFDMRRPVITSNFRNAVNDSRVKTLLDGCERAWSKKHPEHGHTKIPFTLILALQTESLLAADDIHLPGLSTYGDQTRPFIERLRVICALMFGIFFLLRKGEFLPKPVAKNCHHTPMQRSHLRFMDADHKVIPYSHVGNIRASWLSITIEFSKTDQHGRGRILEHFIDLRNPTHCIVQRMEAYIQLTRDLFGAKDSDLLFDIPGFPKFTTDILTYAMQATCHAVGLPWDRCSAHSLRYGGATTLAAAGFPDFVIAFYGGWSQDSTVMRRYIRPSDQIIRKVSHHMTRAQNSVAVQAAVNQILAFQVQPQGSTAFPAPRGRPRQH
jgi:hypothetical protein